jgi:hypothetical protein
MIKDYLIFVLDDSLDENDLGYSGAVEWVYKNLQHSNIFILDISDVYLLQYHSKVFDIINEENQSMLQEGEDDWIVSQDVKKKILSKLLTYLQEIKDNRLVEIVSELIRLLKLSIDTGKNLYFKF